LKQQEQDIFGELMTEQVDQQLVIQGFRGIVKVSRAYLSSVVCRLVLESWFDRVIVWSHEKRRNVACGDKAPTMIGPAPHVDPLSNLLLYLVTFRSTDQKGNIK